MSTVPNHKILRQTTLILGWWFVLMVSGLAQKNGYVWCFPDSILLDFNSIPPQLGKSKAGTVVKGIESAASIADKNGNLLFYFNINFNYKESTTQFFNRKNELIENGDSIHVSFTATNGAIIIPDPAKENQYYSITIDYIGANNLIDDPVLFFHVIEVLPDQTLKVKRKNELLLKGELSEKIAAVQHSNGKDWWIITHGRNDDIFYIFKLDQNGLSKPKTQKIGTPHLGYNKYLGEICFSKNGKKILAVTPSGIIDLFSFDRCSGELSDHLYLGLPEIMPENSEQDHKRSYYGCAFSSDENTFYVTTDFVIYQFHRTENDTYLKDTIALKPESAKLNFQFNQMELGIDGKIYVTYYNSGGFNSIAIIHDPTLVGKDCNFDLAGINLLSNQEAEPCLPNMPNYALGALNGIKADAGNDFTICPKQKVLIGNPPDKKGLRYRWEPSTGLDNPNSPQPYVYTDTTIIYKLTVSDSILDDSCHYAIDYITINVIQPLSVSAGKDTIVCSMKPIMLGDKKNPNHAHYQWIPAKGLSNANSPNPVATVDQNTTYQVIVTDPNLPCSQAKDSIMIGIYNMPQFSIINDTTICLGEKVKLDIKNTSSNLIYEWTPAKGLSNANNPNPIATPEQTTSYSVTIHIPDYPVECNRITKKTKISVKNECYEQVIWEHFLPNTFTPNNDGLNDIYYASLPSVASLHFEIFNRFGVKIFETDQQPIIWHGEQYSEGVYTYLLKITTLTNKEKIIIGNITLFR